MKYNYIELKNSIGIKRYEHSIRVLETSFIINKKYKLDLEKVEKAAIFHDCGKIGNIETIKKLIMEKNIFLSEDDKKSPQILHSILGAYLAKTKYKIQDEDILNAIRYHTIGRPNMTLLEKIIFIADYIEPGRNFQGVDEVRKLTAENIDRGIILAMKNTIKYLKSENNYIHKNTLLALDYFLRKEG